MHKLSFRRNGFTLVELLVVVAIIALLVSILLPTLGKAKEQARIVVCFANLKALHVAFTQYSASNDDWFPAASACGGVIYGDDDGPEYAWDTVLFPEYNNFGMLHCPSDTIDRGEYYVDYDVPEEKRYPKSYAMNGAVSHFGPSLVCEADGYGSSAPPYPWPGRVQKVGAVTDPTDTVLLADMWDSNYGAGGSSYYHYAPNVYGAYQGSYTGFYRSSTTATAPRPGREPTFYHRDNNTANFLFCDGHAGSLSDSDPNITAENGYYYYYCEKP